MDQNFKNYKELIKCLLKDDDISKMLREPLNNYFSKEVLMRIRNNRDLFFSEFEKIKNDKKYEDLIAVTKDISEWIARFLANTRDAKLYRRKFDVIFELLHLQSEEAVNSFPLSEVFLNECCAKKLLSVITRDKLIADLNNKGLTAAKYQFLWEIVTRSDQCYGKLLIILHRNQTNYIEKFFDDLHKSINGCEDAYVESYIMAYAESMIEMNMKAWNNISEGDNLANMESDGGQIAETMDLAVNVMEVDSPSIQNRQTIVKETDCLAIASSSNNNVSETRELAVNVMEVDSPSIQNRPTIVKETDSLAIASSSNNNGSNVKNEDIDDMDNSDDDNVNEDEDDHLNAEKCDILFGKLKGKRTDEILNLSSSNESRKVDSMKLDVRSYQKELAEEGIQGKNVLICAPTGSGKTIVAVKIVEEHMEKNNKGKVAFVVHRIALVEQQYAQFSKYLKCRITRLSGSVKSSGTPLRGHMASFDVFVMTSDILRNALEQDNETRLESVGEFTMILFDECHNCDKKHPYNRIMNHYFKSKESGQKVPQIIGLTASTGTNKANTMIKAMKRLYTLCANLDCYVVSTVKTFVDDLQKNQSVPDEEIIAANPRNEDKFEREMHSQMKTCEHMLQEMNNRDFFPKDSDTQLMFSIPEDRMHQKYSGFIGKLDQKLLNNTKTENEGREAIYAISQYLNAFVRALMVNHLFRAQDATNLIQEYLHIQTTPNITCKVEKILRNNLKKLENCQLMQTPNPCLQMLQDKIIEQLDKDDSSRIIVFVRERAYTQILKDVFTSLNNPKIKCDTIVGNTISSEKGGLTQNEMEEVLGRFRKGQCNVLFSTTVAEEGLDVQKCNLVIRYGHVTNETAMVQSRGRARAQQSKYLVIVPNKLQWQINKENINKYRESMMYKAIEKFQEMNINERNNEIDECKCERQLLENIQNISKMKLRNSSETDRIRLFYCKKCNIEICKSSDIRVAENAHHLIINPNVFDKMVCNEKNSQINCKRCSNHLGNRQNYKNRIFPNLTISSFTLSIEGETSSRSYKKWKDVDFKVCNVSNKELLDYSASHALST